MSSRRSTVLALYLTLALTPALLVLAPALQAQSTDETEAARPDEAEETRRDRKQSAKERRINEYLRKRDEKLARKEAIRSALEEETKSEAAARDLESQQLSESTTPAPVAHAVSAIPQDPPSKKSDRGRTLQSSDLPRGLARAQRNVGGTSLGKDPTVREYLALIEREQATPLQLAAFGNFLAQNGMVKDALEYYEVALRLEDRDPVLWINAGTLHQQINDLSTAASAYTNALEISPNNALAHYNLGTVFSAMDRYDDALAEYKAALVLDPTLGDPTRNPQATNNTLLTAVKLMLYREQVGGLSMPLIEIPTGETGDDTVSE